MTLDLPTNRGEILNRIRADVQNELPDLNPFIRNSFLSAILVGLSGRMFDFSIQQQLLINELFMDTATGEFLERWGSYKDITRNPATQAEGPITVTGVVASSIPISSVLSSLGAEQYETQAAASIVAVSEPVNFITRISSTATVETTADHQFASGMNVTIVGADQTEYNGTFEILVTAANEFTYQVSGTPTTPATGTITADADLATVTVKSLGFGQAVNLESGASLSFSTPLAGIDNTAFVQFDGISGGTDIESDDDLRVRILDAYQNPIALFNVASIVATAKTVPGVTRVFVNEATPDPGQVTVFFTRDNDVDIIPSAGEVSDVKDALLEIKPAMMFEDDLIVEAPVPVNTNFVFSFLSPNTATMKDAITKSLEQFFREETQVGEPVRDFVYLGAIGNTVDLETGQKVEDFSLATPTGDIPVNIGEIAVLGSVSF